MSDFSRKIAQFAESTLARSDKLARVVAIETHNRVKAKSPVDTGQLRASWTVAKNGVPTSFDGSREVISSVKFGDSISIATDKPYAPVIEYGLYPKPGRGKTVDGYSVQAPKGMVRITVQEMESWIKKQSGG